MSDKETFKTNTFLIFFTSMKNVYYVIGEIYKNIYI